MNVICDIDGVVYRGDKLVPGSDDALQRLVRAGAQVFFATNNSTKTPQDVSDRLSRISGVDIASEWIVTSSEAAVRMLREHERPAMVFGGAGITYALEAAGIPITADAKDAGALLVGLDRDLDYDRLTRAADAVRAGARFVATNVDPTFPTAEGLAPGSGAMVAALRATTGVTPEIAGKPHAPMRDLLKTKVTGAAWVIGDRVDTDIALARAEPDWASILVLTGVTTSEEAVGADHVVPDLAAAVDLVLAVGGETAPSRVP